MVCVVEEPADLASIESAGSFRGRYHVLGGTIAPLDGVGPESLRVEALAARVERGGIKELILATNPNPEGEATALYVAERVARYGVPVTRIGYGMPIGGDLEYVDPVTLRKSLENRRTFSSCGRTRAEMHRRDSACIPRKRSDSLLRGGIFLDESSA